MKKRNHQATVTGENNQIVIIAAVAIDPHGSTGRLSPDSEISKTIILRILDHHKFHPYHMPLHHELHRDNLLNMVIFRDWARNQMQLNSNFYLNVLFSVGSGFTNHEQSAGSI